MRSRITSFLQRLQRSSRQPGYLRVACCLSFLDAYFPVMPNEVFLSLGVIARPKEWARIALWFTIASALGATSLAFLVDLGGHAIIDRFFPTLILDPRWIETSQWMDQHGALGLALVALSPFPQHAAVILLALARAPMPVIFAAVFVGRFVKYAIVAWCAGKSPETLKRFRILRTIPSTIASQQR